jgi:acyl-homoserine-lactone acylase
VLTSSESDNPDSPHYADQTELFSRRQWVTAAFCPAQVARGRSVDHGRERSVT